jgi:hypothetical protein
MRAALVAALLCSGCCCDPSSSPAPAPPVPAAKPEPTPGEKALAAITPADDAKRAALLAEGVQNGWIGEIDYPHQRMVVGRNFGALDFKMKNAVVWAVVLDGMRKKGQPSFDLELRDPMTNKVIGNYSCLWWKLTLE